MDLLRISFIHYRASLKNASQLRAKCARSPYDMSSVVPQIEERTQPIRCSSAPGTLLPECLIRCHASIAACDIQLRRGSSRRLSTISMRNSARQFHLGQLPSSSAPAAMETKIRESTQPGWPSISQGRLRFEGTRFLNELRCLVNEHILLSRRDQKKRALLNAGD